jgi:hypothetical protein
LLHIHRFLLFLMKRAIWKWCKIDGLCKFSCKIS